MLAALLLATLCSAASAQLPVISQGGVVNAASYTQPVVPGSIIAIFGTNLASIVRSAAATPLPTILGNTSVSMNGVPAPLFYVSPNQINAQVPSSLSSLINIGGFNTASVVVTTSAGASIPAAVPIYLEGPGVYTVDGSGCGQAAALNVAPDGELSPNSPSNSAAPGDFVSVFGTGFGTFYAPPADGSPATAAQPTEYAGGFTIDGGSVQNVRYLGLAPGLIGTDQANVQIPIGTREGCAVPLAISGAYLISPTVAISINSSRGQCVDPQPQSYGTIALVKTISTGTTQDGETDMLTASFPSGPQLTRPPAENQDLPPGSWTGNSMSLAPSGFCPVPGYVPLSVGPIAVGGPAGSATVTPTSAKDSTAYSLSLPLGFLTAGTFSISAGGSSSVGAFQGTATIPAPIQITAVQQQGGNAPFVITWSGGSSKSVLRISLVYENPVYEQSDYAYTPADAGSYSFMPYCSGNPVPMGNGVFCTFGLPEVNEVVVEQMPPTGQAAVFQATGITGNIQTTWTYRYVFGIGQ